VLIRRLIHVFLRLAPTLLCVTCVPLVTVVLVRGLFGTPLSAFRPILSDEIYYWHEAMTFASAGLRGGYYTLGEVLNASGFTPFGPHGPGYVMLYGLVGFFTGWPRHSVVVINLVVIAAACWVWATAARVSTARLWLSVLFLATCWQIVFWSSTGMQETFHHAGAIAMAALCARALASPPSAWLAAIGIAVLCVLSFARPTWIILMPIWALIIARDANPPRLVTRVTASLVLAGLVLIAYSRSVAPFAMGFFFLKALSLSVGINAVANNLTFNLARTFTTGEYDVLEILHRAQYWLFLAAGIVLAIYARWRHASWKSGQALHLAVAVAAMGAALALMLLLYTLTNWAEHRVLSAFLVFGGLITLAAPGRGPVLLVAALIASNVATATTFRRVFEAKRQEQYIWDRRGVLELEEALAGRMIYRAGEPRWCNTLLTAQEPPYLIAVPAGIGISIVREPDQMRHVPHSRYLLVDESTLHNFQQSPRVDRLATLPYGNLYLNRDADCRDGITR
jgi:hypothetical protein